MDKSKFDYANELKDKAYSKEKELTEKSSITEKRNLSTLFEQTGDAFLDLRDQRLSKVVLTFYEKAKEYTPYSEVKKRIGKKILNIEYPEHAPGLSNLEKIVRGKNVRAILSIGFLISALFFVSSSLTGNVIAGLVPNKSRFIGICLFACGLIFAFLYSKTKTKNKKRKK